MSRSASGSANFPNSDSTRQRRASQPSIWSVAPASGEEARGHVAPFAVGSEDDDDEHGDEREPNDRQRVRDLRERMGNGAGLHRVEC